MKVGCDSGGAVSLGRVPRRSHGRGTKVCIVIEGDATGVADRRRRGFHSVVQPRLNRLRMFEKIRNHLPRLIRTALAARH